MAAYAKGKSVGRKNTPERRPLPRYAPLFAGAGAGLVALGISLVASPQLATQLSSGVAFLVYLAMTLYEAPCLTPGFLRKRAADADAPVVVIFSVVVVVIGVAFFALFESLNQTSLDVVGVSLSIGAVLLGWFTVHTMAGLHYAYEYYEVPEQSSKEDGVVGGLGFPAGDAPDGWAFIYFSFVIGMTAQVADVNVTSNAMRRVVLVHGVFSFLFNTVIVAATVNAVVSLAGGA